MSEKTDTPDTLTPRQSQQSEAARRTLETSPRTPVQIATDALTEIRDSAQRILEYESSDSGTTSPVNVIHQREFSFRDIDPSLLLTDAIDNQSTDGQASSTISHPSQRRDFSLTSYDSDIFDPEEIYNAQNMERTPTPASKNRETNEIRPEDVQGRSTQIGPTEPNRSDADRSTSSLLNEILREIRDLKNRMNDMEERELQHAPLMDRNRAGRDNPRNTMDVTYGRTRDDVRNRPGTSGNYMRLKEARSMIPEFDGSSRNRVREFLSASSYAMRTIDPTDEPILLEAILCTKLKGKAMTDFYARDVRSYEQLKNEIEKEYLSKRSTTHLQVEFNSLRQKHGETAQEFGRRVDTIAMELYESTIEGGTRSLEHQQVILETIKEQALRNFQSGLNGGIRFIVRSQNYSTLQEAIAGASAEEKERGPNYRNQTPNENKSDDTQQLSASVPQCRRCGKSGHYSRDCRSKYVLPKAEGHLRVNALNKFCKYCRKTGHVREECWLLNGRPKIENHTQSEANANKNSRGFSKNDNKKEDRKTVTDSESQNSDDDENEDANSNRTRTAAEYRVTHIRRTPLVDTGLDLISLRVLEAERRKIKFLFDTGASISLVKLKMLKGKTLIHEDMEKLTGITGHSFTTIGKTYVTIQLDDDKIKHPIYVVKDNAPMEYDGILGADFIRNNEVSCKYKTNQVTIGSTHFKLEPYRVKASRSRRETITQVIAHRNSVPQSRESLQEKSTENYLLKSRNLKRPVKMSNMFKDTYHVTTVKNTGKQERACINQCITKRSREFKKEINHSIRACCSDVQTGAYHCEGRIKLHSRCRTISEHRRSRSPTRLREPCITTRETQLPLKSGSKNNLRKRKKQF